MALSGFHIIGADGHVTEPATLYRTHIHAKFRARAEALSTRLGAFYTRLRG